ncbi:MAG: hypothetical protein LUF02_04080 [Erysipelotrichaceae bacterium]|nr:hypothetical protein [Erysipelotrichaceae bacterium]
MIVSGIVGMYRIMSHTYNVQDYNEDLYIAAKQVSQYTLGTYCVSLSDNYTYIDYDEQENTLILDNGRLVKKPGFEILLSNIDNLSFSNNNEMIYMTVERDNKEYTFLIGFYREKSEHEEDETNDETIQETIE